MIFLAVGTGIGAGISFPMAAWCVARADIAGAVGWFALNPAHHEIYAQVGCWEAESAGPGLARRHNVTSAEEALRRRVRGMPLLSPRLQRQCGIYLAWALPISSASSTRK